MGDEPLTPALAWALGFYQAMPLRLLTLCVLLLALFTGLTQGVERRRNQFPTDFGYLVAPIPYIIPGSKPGIALLGGFNNISFGNTPSTVDAYVVLIGGGVTGTVTAVSDISLWSETLLLDLTHVKISKGSQKTYRDRRMNSDPKNFLITELSDTNLQGGRLILTLFDRMFELFTIQYDISASISAIRDNKEKLLYEKKQSFEVKSRTYGSQLDWTDDRVDPRKGVRLVYTYADSPARTSVSADYYVQSYNATGYLPVLSNSMIAFNWFEAGATVRKQGNTDLDSLIDLEEARCVANCDNATITDLATNQQTLNSYGSAGTLGGASRLRSYAGGRYSGAQLSFRAIEFRWNLTDENTPFDFYLIRDIRTGLQLAFFYEEGSVADTRSDLWKEKRTSTGAGARVVTSSGFVYRFDVANGQEGSEVILFVDYPWGTIGQ